MLKAFAQKEVLCANLDEKPIHPQEYNVFKVGHQTDLRD